MINRKYTLKDGECREIKEGNINYDYNVISNEFDDFFYDTLSAYNHFKKEAKRCGVELTLSDFIKMDISNRYRLISYHFLDCESDNYFVDELKSIRYAIENI